MNLAENTSTIVEQNYTPESSTPMKLSDTNHAHIIRSLIDMYKNPVVAIIREYSANAWDAHVQAGNTDTPIEVTLPNAFGNDSLIIKDFGVGMGEQRLKEFVSMGDSFKTEDANQTGAYGMGSKSAMSLVSQFTVVSIQDGMKRVVVICEDEEGGIRADTLKTVETDEPNGTTISIPIPKDRIFEVSERAAKFFYHWEPGTVLVNGKAPDSMSDRSGYQKIGVHHIWDKFRFSANFASVQMGSVTYPVEMEHLPEDYHKALRRYNYAGGMGVLLTAPAESLNLVLNRDNLRYTNKTIKTLSSLLDDFSVEYVKRISAEIKKAEDAEDYKSALKLYSKHKNVIEDMDKPVIKGEEMNLTLSPKRDDKSNPLGFLIIGNRHAGRMSYTGKTIRDRAYSSTFGADSIDTTTVVFVNEEEASKAERGMSVYAEFKDVSKIVLIVGDYEENSWVSNIVLETLEFDEFMEEVKEFRKRKREASRAAGGQRGGRVTTPVTYEIFELNDEGEVSQRDDSLADMREAETDYYYYESDCSLDETVLTQMFSRIPKRPVVLISKNKKSETLKSRLKDHTVESILGVFRNTVEQSMTEEDYRAFFLACNSTSADHSLAVRIIESYERMEGSTVAQSETGKDILSLRDMIQHGKSLRDTLYQTVGRYAVREMDSYEENKEAAEKFFTEDEKMKSLSDDILLSRFPMLRGIRSMYGNDVESIFEYLQAMEMLEAHKAS